MNESYIYLHTIYYYYIVSTRESNLKNDLFPIRSMVHVVSLLRLFQMHSLECHCFACDIDTDVMIDACICTFLVFAFEQEKKNVFLDSSRILIVSAHFTMQFLHFKHFQSGCRLCKQMKMAFLMKKF